ncbi:ubiquitin carboxyl-terminal hydrolase 48 [Cryptococcus neoformans var. grubii Br795]|nr:ubiquitin carboxyl-terminal hydrolase 48 [Cryptococcus neoformans var. grubii Br795]OXG80652.1 ubiquitin carboxyl-terminal hydrolase 48 [Cryptococcus neoformans var. grubii D17-1]OXG93412.1 ubiquitin carboxyl-terminal hydrolase 48 [Cryptococcus neoformans var. grubii A2-102-5]
MVKTSQKPCQDWDWVGTEVQTPAQITLEHRRRAAGLVGGVACHRDLTGHERETATDDSEVKMNGKGAGKKKGTGCRAKGCKSNYMCYNNLGTEKLLEPDAKAEFVISNLGDVPEERNGPAGLRNLGATCYANAFLQLWFRNIPFSNAVYACVTSETTPLYQLALIFAKLEYSEKSVVDPMGLVDSLRLNTGDQQDAAEFSKLFMSLIASEFSKHPDPKLKTLVRDQFEGTMQYITQCECGYESISETTFLELELSLKDNATLQSRLDEFTRPEILDGDNKYFCPSCLSKRRATRRQLPVVLPPVIHFSLLRFVFDLKSMSRKKSKASIKYPKEAVLGNSVYELRGVISHQGTSAYHGHFICETYDENNDIWYICNDELVQPKPARPHKKAKLDKPGDDKDKIEWSKDAYMLVYKRRDGRVPPQPPPAIVMKKVKEENRGLREELNKVEVRKEVLEDEWEHLKGAKMDVIRTLPGTEYIIPREALAKWIQSPSFQDLYTPFDYSSILCAHSQVDPLKSSDTRTISALAHDKLSSYTSLPEIDVCTICVAEGFVERLSITERQSTLGTFDELNAQAELEEVDEGERWCLPKTWLVHWRTGKLPPQTLPTHPSYTLLCPHIAPLPPSSAPPVTLITSSALSLLHSIFGSFPSFQPGTPPCPECSFGADQDAESLAQWKTDVKLDKSIKRHLDPRPPAFGLDYYVLPKEFIEKWEVYMKTPGGEKPELDMGLGRGRCEHGMLDWDPQMEKTRVINEIGWGMLCQKYGEKEPIKVQFGANPPEGKKVNISSFTPGVCEPCRIARLSSYDELEIPIVFAPTPPISSFLSYSIPASTGNTSGSKLGSGASRNASRALRSRLKTLYVQATRQSTIKDLKLSILSETGITPLLQKIYYKSRTQSQGQGHHRSGQGDEEEKELDNDLTIGKLGYLKGEELILVEVKEEGNLDDDDDDIVNGGNRGKGRNGKNEGFGGTALLARIACPDCTYENDGAAECCEMCMRVSILSQGLYCYRTLC